jgi:hypothetical protein
MQSTIQSRAQFLVLAEFCLRITSSLLDYVNGAKPLQADVLREALAALKSVQSGDANRFGKRSAAALSSYVEVRTLEEAWTPEQISDAIRLTADLLADAQENDARREKARELLVLFSRLQTVALWNFEQPRRVPSPDLGELSDAFKGA